MQRKEVWMMVPCWKMRHRHPERTRCAPAQRQVASLHTTFPPLSSSLGNTGRLPTSAAFPEHSHWAIPAGTQQCVTVFTPKKLLVQRVSCHLL